MNKEILKTLSYGMYAIGVNGEMGPSASISNTVFQVSQNPLIISVSINNCHYTNECINNSKLFTVSVISEETPGTVIGALGFFSGKDTNKLKNIHYKILEEKVPVIKENTCCWFLCKAIKSIKLDTHTIFLAEIISGSEKYRFKPMTYDYYHNIIKGAAPKGAPTYQEKRISPSQDEYVCTICGYVYNDPYIPFEDLQESWICPICGMPKSVFKLK